MIEIEYVGLKEVKTDNVADTGLVWRGCGDVHPVPEEAAQKLLRYPGVWRVVGDAALTVTQEPAKSSEEPPTSVDAGQANDKAALLSVARGMGLDVDGRTSAKRLAEMIDEAQKKVVV
jgi:hypothetical protein